jgi:predicted phosphoribosyltransferase
VIWNTRRRSHLSATPQPFHAVGLFYEDFTQVTNDGVRDMLASSRNDTPASSHNEEQSTEHYAAK